MKNWKYLVGITCTVVTLATAASCAGEDRNAAALAAESTSEVEQHADGCGAFRYRGSSNLSCSYKGRIITHGDAVKGTCVNANRISCTYDLVCDFIVESVSTSCTDDREGLCFRLAPPEASDPVPQSVYVFPLEVGDKMCDPPGGQTPNAQTLKDYCQDHSRRAPAYYAARDFCEASTSYNSSGASCCLNCPSPLPATGGPPACYETDGGPPGPDGGVGIDAGVPNPFDAGHYLDAITEIRR